MTEFPRLMWTNWMMKTAYYRFTFYADEFQGPMWTGYTRLGLLTFFALDSCLSSSPVSCCKLFTMNTQPNTHTKAKLIDTRRRSFSIPPVLRLSVCLPANVRMSDVVFLLPNPPEICVKPCKISFQSCKISCQSCKISCQLSKISFKACIKDQL